MPRPSGSEAHGVEMNEVEAGFDISSAYVADRESFNGRNDAFAPGDMPVGDDAGGANQARHSGPLASALTRHESRKVTFGGDPHHEGVWV